ncbi:hypothetical protein C0995_011028 [Termitomyces sp. Mi166|nr:hypothetical protein C0995_011028 [Termitomyces sp. Mi166\
MQRKGHALKRHLNRLEHRVPESEAAPSSASLVNDSPSPSSSTVAAASLPPTSVAAIATVLSLIAAAVILGQYSRTSTGYALISLRITGIVICVYRKYKRRTARASPSTLAGKVIVETEYQSYSEKQRIDLTDVSIYTEKPEKAVLTPRSLDSEPAGWVPQIRAYPQPNLPLPKPAASPKSNKSPKLSVTTMPVDTPQSPPPSYLMARASGEDQTPRSTSIPLSSVVSTTRPPLPTPPANRRTKTSSTSLTEQPMQALSPRSESFTPQDLVSTKEPSSPTSDELTQKFPRLMTVSASFAPALDDELAIKIGDTVRMLEEYRDGWCLVQRVGRIDAPKGAVPRFCLQERRGVVPIVPSRKYSSGSLKSQASGWR